MPLSDLLRPRNLEDLPTAPPVLMVGEVADINPLRVTLAALDGRARTHLAFGTYPDAVAGDQVRVMHDEDGGLVVVAWEAS